MLMYRRYLRPIPVTLSQISWKVLAVEKPAYEFSDAHRAEFSRSCALSQGENWMFVPFHFVHVHSNRMIIAYDG